MIIKRQKEFTSKATKALRKHILGTTGTPREWWMTNKEYEREIAEAAKEKLGRGQVERKLSSKQINRKIKFHEDRYKTATNPSTHDYHKSQLDLWKARRQEYDHPKIEREKKTFISFKDVNGEPKIDKVKNFSDMILKRQKEFGEVKRANKAARRKWETAMVKHNLEKDPVARQTEGLTLALMKQSQEVENRGKTIRGKATDRIPKITMSEARLHDFRRSGRKVATGNIWADHADAFNDLFGKSSYTLEELEGLKQSDPEMFKLVRKRKAEALREAKKSAELAAKEKEKEALDQAKKQTDAMRNEIKKKAPERLKNIKKAENIKKLKKAAPYVAAGTIVAAGTGVTIKKASDKKKKDNKKK